MRGEREHWVLSNCSQTHQGRVQSLTNSFKMKSVFVDGCFFVFFFALFSLEGPFHFNAIPGRHGAPLHCSWDAVAAPVADVSGSNPIGRSPLFAVINLGCIWKK